MTTDPYAANAAWPSGWGTCHLTGFFLGLDGSLVSGTLTLTMAPDTVFVVDAEKQVDPVDITLTVTAGVLDAYVPGSDSPAIQPSGWTYHAVQDWNGREYDFVAPTGLTVDITQVAPVGKYQGVLVLAQQSGLTEAQADARYIRTVNGTGPDSGGNVVVSGGGSDPSGVTSGADGSLTLTPGTALGVASDGAGGLILTDGGYGVADDGAGGITLGIVDVASSADGSLTLTPGAQLTVSSDADGGLDLGGVNVVEDGAGALVLT